MAEHPPRCIKDIGFDRYMHYEGVRCDLRIPSVCFGNEGHPGLCQPGLPDPLALLRRANAYYRQAQAALLSGNEPVANEAEHLAYDIERFLAISQRAQET